MVSKHVPRSICVGALAFALASCSSPVSPAGSVTVASPSLLSPANGATIANTNQPVTLTVSNAFVSDSTASVVYTFEVATDSAFASKVQTKTASPGTGQTSVVLGILAGGQTYYWHARVQGADTPGTFSPTQTFTVGQAISLTAPSPVSPLNGANPSGWPTFTVSNSVASGPVGQVTYKFEVSTTPSFAADVLSQTVPQGTNQTSFTPPFTTTVLVGQTLYWRATAVDAVDNITSTPSSPQTFVSSPLTQQALIGLEAGYGSLWPGTQPPGTNGQAILGNGWNPSLEANFNGVQFQNPPLECLREFDLIDRGMDPQTALDWQNQNGYPTVGFYDSSKLVIGYTSVYIAFVDGTWNLVLRSGG